jgi:hypothetical protein
MWRHNYLHKVENLAHKIATGNIHHKEEETRYVGIVARF